MILHVLCHMLYLSFWTPFKTHSSRGGVVRLDVFLNIDLTNKCPSNSHLHTPRILNFRTTWAYFNISDPNAHFLWHACCIPQFNGLYKKHSCSASLFSVLHDKGRFDFTGIHQHLLTFLKCKTVGMSWQKKVILCSIDV